MGVPWETTWLSFSAPWGLLILGGMTAFFANVQFQSLSRLQFPLTKILLRAQGICLTGGEACFLAGESQQLRPGKPQCLQVTETRGSLAIWAKGHFLLPSNTLGLGQAVTLTGLLGCLTHSGLPTPTPSGSLSVSTGGYLNNKTS